MKCRICASECPPGAKLCRDCAAARKRAFAATVTQPLLAAAGAPSIGRPRFAPRPARSRPANKPVAASAAGRSEAVMAASAEDARPAAKKPIGVQWLLLALALACAVIYLLVRVLFAPHTQPSDEVASGEAPGGSGTPTVSAGSTPPAALLAPTTPLPAAGATPAAVGSAESNVAGAALKNASAKPRRKVAARVEPAAPAAPAPPAPPPQPVAVAPIAPPPVVVAPPDPWQAMNEGLSRCGREDWMHRVACERRLRMQYCPNHWGVVWQCPIGPMTDHGQ